jgi:hypothetical protein
MARQSHREACEEGFPMRLEAKGQKSPAQEDNRIDSPHHHRHEGVVMATKTTKRKSAGKKSTGKKKSTRKYSPAAGKQVETEMRAMKRGTLKSGRSGKKVTNPKQAIAIGLSEARKAGAKVPTKKS